MAVRINGNINMTGSGRAAPLARPFAASIVPRRGWDTDHEPGTHVGKRPVRPPSSRPGGQVVRWSRMPGRSLNVAPTEKVRRGLLEYRASAQFCRRSRCQRTSVERRA